MHYKKVKGILSPSNGMNLYRGCTHGCIYCDSRSNCYQINHVFEDIEIKENALELLEQRLQRKHQKCMIGTGAMTDPYLHLEETIQYTRKSLEIIEKYGYGVTIHTKSNRILRDLDLLKKINENAKCVVQITLTTYDEQLCQIIEPNVSTTKERVEVLKIMRDNNIPTIVWLDPILPFLNDTEENILGILNYCIEAKVYGIICFNMGLTLREGNREYFYQKLEEHFPGLKERYQHVYGMKYEINSPHNIKLMNLFHKVCKEHHIETNIHTLFSYLHTFPIQKEQLSLFDKNL